MVCRAPTSATTCTGGSPTGAQLTYDGERRLKQYQDAPTAPSVTAYYLYDGEGNRVQQAVVTGTGTATTTYLPGGVEEVRPDGGVTKYYTAGGLALGLNTATDASGISYLASDGLGSVSESLNGSGSVTSQQLYAPYGAIRYSSGVSPTAKGFTGQRSDASVSGLDYYGARYYDPTLGQFASSDGVMDGLNRYGYVGGNPETAADPTGHMYYDPYGGGCTDDCNISIGGHTIEAEPKGGQDCNYDGCAFANARRAVVGKGRVAQKGAGKQPAIYAWGNDENGAYAVGFSGQSLQALIAGMSRWLEWWEGAKGADDTYGDPTSEAIGKFIGFFLAAFGDPEVAEYSDASEIVGEQVLDLARTVVGIIAQGGIDQLKSGISALQHASDVGATAWYVEAVWHGKLTENSQAIGFADFEWGWGASPPLDVLFQVGNVMVQQCSGAGGNSPWGNSPGVYKNQDSSYVYACV